MNISKVGVIGAGTMGNGIAQVCASAGLEVIMQDVGEAQTRHGLETIATSFDRMIKKDKATEAEKLAALGRITTTTVLEEAADVDRGGPQ